MKKKGLIISTVVMVVVLIASLTTATYAWFNTSSFTSIDGFNLEVVSSNAVKIGLRQNITAAGYTAADNADAFMYGDCTFSGTAGSLAGNWTGGQSGLGASINHNIIWGQVNKSVGVTTADTTTNFDGVTGENTKGFDTNATGTYSIVAANGNGQTTGPLDNVALANANRVAGAEGADDTAGDYAYLYLGVQPTAALNENTNNIYVIVQAGGTTQTLGLAACVHVAYRVNGGAWTDADVFASDVTQATQKSAAKCTLENKDATDKTIEIPNTASLGGLTPKTVSSGKYISPEFEGAGAATIGLSTDVDTIQHVEIIIYIAGWDKDCDNGIGGQVNVGIFFGAQLATVGA